MGEVAWTSTEMAPLRKAWTDKGGRRASLFAVLRAVDPVDVRPAVGQAAKC